MNPLIWAAIIEIAFKLIMECREKEQATEADVINRLQEGRLLDKLRIVRKLDLSFAEKREALAYLKALKLNEEEAKEIYGLYSTEDINIPKAEA